MYYLVFNEQYVDGVVMSNYEYLVWATNCSYEDKQTHQVLEVPEELIHLFL